MRSVLATSIENLSDQPISVRTDDGIRLIPPYETVKNVRLEESEAVNKAHLLKCRISLQG